MFSCSFVSMFSGLQRFSDFAHCPNTSRTTPRLRHLGALLTMSCPPMFALFHLFSLWLESFFRPPCTLPCSWHVYLFAAYSASHATVIACSSTPLHSMFLCFSLLVHKGPLFFEPGFEFFTILPLLHHTSSLLCWTVLALICAITPPSIIA